MKIIIICSPCHHQCCSRNCIYILTTANTFCRPDAVFHKSDEEIVLINLSAKLQTIDIEHIGDMLSYSICLYMQQLKHDTTFFIVMFWE